ncbi:MAG: hypothetical protein KBS74_06900 [Clostridiales bacterium]|nr:hypothetical protein [Candidatus Cacconaster stercorequi]
MDKGLDKWNEYVTAKKDPEQLFTASKIESEKLAIAAGLVKPEFSEEIGPDKGDAITSENGLLGMLQKANNGKAISKEAADNIHKVMAAGEKNRELLSNAVQSKKEGELFWTGDTAIQSIVAAETLKQVIQNGGQPFAEYVGGFENFLDLLGGKDFPDAWRNLTEISNDVKYASNVAHDGAFFAKNVLSENGLKKMANSVSEKFPDYLHKVTDEMSKDAQVKEHSKTYSASKQYKQPAKTSVAAM